MNKIYSLCILAASFIAAPAAHALTVDEICGTYTAVYTLKNSTYYSPFSTASSQGEVTIAKAASGKITITGFIPSAALNSGFSLVTQAIEADFDEATGTVTIPMTEVLDYAYTVSGTAYTLPLTLATGTAAMDGDYEILSGAKDVQGTYDASTVLTFPDWAVYDSYYEDVYAVNCKTVLTPKSLAAIDGIGADTADAPVEYFNLQGIRVDNPRGGIFIRRQGNKVQKVQIR